MQWVSKFTTSTYLYLYFLTNFSCTLKNYYNNANRQLNNERPQSLLKNGNVLLNKNIISEETSFLQGVVSAFAKKQKSREDWHGFISRNFQLTISIYNYKQTFLIFLLSYASLFSYAQNEVATGAELVLTAQEALDSLQYERAISLAEKVITTYQNIPDDNLMKALNIKGDAFRELGKYDDAIEQYTLSKGTAISLQGKKSSAVAQANNDLGLCYWRKGNINQAVVYFSEALSSRIQLYGNQHSKVADSYNNLGNCAFDNRDLTTARDYYEQSLQIRLNVLDADHLDIASSYNNLGSCYRNANQLEQAIDYYSKSLKIRKIKLGNYHPKVAQSCNNLGQSYEQMDELETAISYFQQSIQIYEANTMAQHPDIATSYLGLGACYSKFKNHQKALDFFEKALDIQQVSFGLENANLISVYNNLANAYKNLGDYKQAMSFYENNIHLLNKWLGEQHPFTAATHNNIGLIQVELLDFDDALNRYQQALVIYNQQEDYHRIASTWNNIGSCLRQQKKYSDAIQAYQRSRSIFEQLYGAQTIHNAAIYYNIGNCLGEENQYDEAITYYDKAVSINKNNNSKLASYATSIGTIYQRQGRLEDALQQFEKALTLLQVDINQIDDIEFVQSPVETVSLLNAKAKTLLQYIAPFSNSSFLDILQTVDFSTNVIYNLRKQIQEEYSKRKLSELAYETFEIGIVAANQLYQQTKDIQYLEKAFRYSEQSRGSLILEEQLSQKAATTANIPDSLLEKEYQLKISIAYYEKQKYTSDNNTVSVEEANNILFNQKQDYQQLVQQLEEDYPTYYQQKFKDNLVTIDNLQGQLSSEEAIVEYFVSDTTVYIFLIQNHAASLTTVVVDSLVEEVELLREGITRYYRDYETQSEEGYRFLLIQYLRAAHFLYQKLIQPIAEQLPPKLTVINSQILHYVPFDALVTKLPKGALHRLRDITYLIQQHEINYASSATLLYNSKNSKRTSPAKKLLAFAPTFIFPNPLGLAPLSHNTKEIEQIQTLIPEAEIYLDSAASKDNFISLASDFEILHLATHAKADNDLGDYSYLAFANKGDTTQTTERVLYAKDIYHLPLQANLVVLSACETGKGEILRGEGVVSLARAFTYAGAKSIITTLWSINDATTKDVINSFYKNLNEGFAVGESLRNAKLQYIEQADDPNPFFWAAFTLTGESEILQSNSASLSSPLLTFMACVLLLLLLYFFYRVLVARAS